MVAQGLLLVHVLFSLQHALLHLFERLSNNQILVRCSRLDLLACSQKLDQLSELVGKVCPEVLIPLNTSETLDNVQALAFILLLILFVEGDFSFEIRDLSKKVRSGINHTSGNVNVNAIRKSDRKDFTTLKHYGDVLS
jgi:hypothetical protein